MRKTQISCLAVLIFTFQVRAFSQQSSGVEHLTSNFFQDERNLWTSPLHIHRADIEWLVPLGIGAAALLATDRGISGEVAESNSIQQPSHVVSQAGSFPVYLTPAALLLLGHLSGAPQTTRAGSVGLQAVLHSELIVQVLKVATNRERPSKLQGDGGFWDGGKSFPSGHSISTWALAAALADQYSDKKWVAIGGYGIATAVGLSRIGGQNHFPSDVLIGSSMGWLIGHYVSRHHRN